MGDECYHSRLSRHLHSCFDQVFSSRAIAYGCVTRGGRILDAYLTRVHLRYPFLDRSDILERHGNRFVQDNTSPKDQYGTFKIYMIYAIGATMLKLTEAYDYTPPENFFMKALQYISAARESHSVHNIEAMTLLVLYNLRSPSNSGIVCSFSLLPVRSLFIRLDCFRTRRYHLAFVNNKMN